jgi:sigma-B regulation protein RsbU (phosphoserine phosphatase)
VSESKQTRENLKSKIKDLKLSMLLEITKGINNNVSTSSLFEIFQDILQKPLNIGRAMLFYASEEGWICRFSFGVDTEIVKKIDIERDLLSVQEIRLVESSNYAEASLDKQVPGATIGFFDVVIPIYHKQKPLAYLLLGDINEDALNISPIIKHLPFIQTMANVILVAVENKRLYKDNLQKERIKRELELASEMQNMLFPSKLPNDEYLELGAKYKPHSEVGGDYYDFIRLNDDEVVLCVADVSGKGVSAALLMANFQANLRALVKYSDSLSHVVHELNTKVLESAKGEKFVTLFIAKYNNKTRVLNYINAAHYPPFLLNQQEIISLEKGCTGIGMLDQIWNIEEGRVVVQPGSLMVCYTDGIIDLENEAGVSFDQAYLERAIQKHQHESIEILNSKILEQLEAHKGDMPYVDDIALLTCRFL